MRWIAYALFSAFHLMVLLRISAFRKERRDKDAFIALPPEGMWAVFRRINYSERGQRYYPLLVASATLMVLSGIIATCYPLP